MKDQLGVAIVGAALGFGLSRMGFTSWDEVHRMFTFGDLRLFLTFMCGAGTLIVAWAVVRRLTSPHWFPRVVHPGTLPGGVIFGLGWAVSGACPGAALAQIGEGQLGALWTLLGILAGNYVYAWCHERYFRWSTASCVDQ